MRIIGESSEWAEVMDNIAEAGGTEQYIAAESDEFVDVLMDIIGGIISCEFDIDWESLADDVDTDPSKVNFYCKQSLNEENNDDIDTGNIIPFDEGCADGSGWDWVDDTFSAVIFCPDLCTKLREGGCPVVTATFGCETIIIP